MYKVEKRNPRTVINEYYFENKLHAALANDFINHECSELDGALTRKFTLNNKMYIDLSEATDVSERQIENGHVDFKIDDEYQTIRFYAENDKVKQMECGYKISHTEIMDKEEGTFSKIELNPKTIKQLEDYLNGYMDDRMHEWRNQ